MDAGDQMSYRERDAWVSGIAVVGAYVLYLVVLYSTTRGSGLVRPEYTSVLTTMFFGFTIVRGVLHVGWRIATDTPMGWRAPSDERDREIRRTADYAGYIALSIGALIAFLLTVSQADGFWTAHELLTAFVIGQVASSLISIVGYRRGLPAWMTR